ncbi:MAG: NTP transferase domain-containing protein [Pseudomonadota bacterium]
MDSATTLSGEHAEDVLGALRDWTEAGKRHALVIVMSTEGGAVRAPGAMFAVSETESVGYISGGCIDADVVLQARHAILDGKTRVLRYGAGSPFVDLPLPCGGAIEVAIIPAPDQSVIEAACGAFAGRRAFDLIVSPDGALKLRGEAARAAKHDFVFSYTPKLRLRIAGRGADALALAKISEAAGLSTHLQLVDEDDLAAAASAGLSNVEQLTTPSQGSRVKDDAWTAFVLMFHDGDWEVPLLKQALAGPAFYIGAVGSKRTHAARCAALERADVAAADIARIRGPIGLVGSLRDASLLAISALAEIVEAFPGKSSSRRPRTAFLLLAAGASSRFEDGDKLLAEIDGQSVLARTAAQPFDDEMVTKVAIVAPDRPRRKEVLQAAGWQVVENPDADQGQASSIIAGIDAIEATQNVDQIMVLLGDMPFVSRAHLEAIHLRASAASITAIMSESDGTLLPPALFKRVHFEALSDLSGDRGAKAVFLSLGLGAERISLPTAQAIDIDRVEDIKGLKELINA